MGALHELLAAEVSLRETARATLKNVVAIFTTGAERLRGIARTYSPEEEAGQEFPSERAERASSVDVQLANFTRDYGAWIDASVQKEMTNTRARAELVLDGISFGELPATGLLNLENKLGEIISLYEKVPVNDPAVQWEWDVENSQWRSPIETRFKTEKRQEAIVLYAATPEHPAQTQLITRDVRIGKYETVYFSGLLAQSDLSLRIERARSLLVAVKKARAKANGEEAETFRIAERIFAYINNGNS